MNPSVELNFDNLGLGQPQQQQPLAFNFDLLNVINSNNNKQDQPNQLFPQPNLFGALPVNNTTFDPFAQPIPTGVQITNNTNDALGLNSVTEKKVDNGAQTTNKQGWNLPDEFTEFDVEEFSSIGLKKDSFDDDDSFEFPSEKKSAHTVKRIGTENPTLQIRGHGDDDFDDEFDGPQPFGKGKKKEKSSKGDGEDYDTPEDIDAFSEFLVENNLIKESFDDLPDDPTRSGKFGLTKMEKQQLEDEWIKQNRFVCIVSTPRVETVKSFGISTSTYTFTITTKLNVNAHANKAIKINLSNNTFRCTRTYTDFLFFHSHLKGCFPFSIIPPLPLNDLRTIVNDYLNPQDVPQQMASGMQYFLNRLGRNPKFSKVGETVMFFSDTPEQYLKFSKAKHEYSLGPLVAGSIFSGGPVIKDHILGPAYVDILAFKEYLKVLYSQALALQSAAASLSSCYTKFANELTKLGSMSQPHARQVIEATTHADTLMSHFSSAIQQKSKFIQQQAHLDETILVEKIEYLLQYTRAAQETLERFSNLEAKYIEARASVQRREERVNKEKALSKGVETGKLRDLNKQLSLAVLQSEYLTNTYSKAKTRVIFEVRVFHKFKIAEINHWMAFYASKQAGGLKDLLTIWSANIPEL